MNRRSFLARFIGGLAATALFGFQARQSVSVPFDLQNEKAFFKAERYSVCFDKIITPGRRSPAAATLPPLKELFTKS